MRDIGPIILDTVPTVTVIVPPSWPVHDGWFGTPPGLTVIVYGNVVPASVPVRKPLNSTVPLGRPTSTGPLTLLVALCVSVHVMRPEIPCTVRSVPQRPVRSI